MLTTIPTFAVEVFVIVLYVLTAADVRVGSPHTDRASEQSIADFSYL
jgi:hypothetical protein